ncbi:MAG: GTP-binding protein [Oscillospiraceae bacterium]|nr:GTP-binding protein [Oscillospiraceae bacterium]
MEKDWWKSRLSEDGRVLNLGGTKLTSLEGVELPANLQRLYLVNTELTSLEGVELLTNLQVLNLSGTKLTSLEGVELPTNLQVLNLSGTKLATLPNTIKGLKKLRRLDLSYMKLKELPDWLPELGLPFERGYLFHGIGLRKTTVEGVDMSIFDQSQEDILRWFEERKKQRETPLNEIKVVFLGDGDVGKTHTISRLQKDGALIPESSTGGSTPGIAISDKTYPIDGQDIRAHFWDFGGQDILYSMHRMFMTERTIYVVMVDARKENCGAQATEWLDTIKSFAGNAPVLLAVNKIDQNDNATLDRRGLIEKYPNLNKVIYMSALKDDPETFNEKFTQSMVELIRRSDVPKMKWPKNWKRVKDELQNMDEPYIRSREYGKICARCEVDSGGENLLNWCNDLGVCFCRQDDRLKDYVILRPDWITNAVYAVLFNKREKVKNGMIDLTEMFRLLNSDETRKTFPDIPYVWGDMDYILNVVRKFSLSYQVDGDTEFFPMLCSADSSPMAREYAEDKHVLEFHMEFEHLPSNILHRLMVERYGELDTDNVWLTGARFCQKDTKLSAIARKDGNRLKLYVRSDDPRHAANTYLSVMAGTVKQICDTLKLKISKRLVIYKEDDQRVEFDYDDLLFELEMGDTHKTCKELRKRVLIADILKQSGHSADRAQEKLMTDIVQFCEMLQDNNKIWDGSEDERTTYIRDLLRAKGYIANDQTRGGISGGDGEQAGELDLDIRLKPAERLTIFEALNLKGSAESYRRYWNAHLDKLLDNYNSTGCPFLFHVTYLSCAKDAFAKHCVTFEDHMRYYSPRGFSLTSERPTDPLAKRNIRHGGFLRAMECVYDCGGIPMTVYHFFVRIGE